MKFYNFNFLKQFKRKQTGKQKHNVRYIFLKLYQEKHKVRFKIDFDGSLNYRVQCFSKPETLLFLDFPLEEGETPGA